MNTNRASREEVGEAFKSSRRERYLKGTLKLKHDPFAYATAELELQVTPEDPPFFSYFVEPPYVVEQHPASGGQPLLDRLKEPEAAFIYGQAGSGKTTLRYQLEALCRAIPDRTLVISHTIGKGKQTDLTNQPPWIDLSQALATDLFVQFLEQFNAFGSTVEANILEALGQYWQANIPSFHRNLSRHLLREQSSQKTDVSTWWATWKRAVVRYAPLTAGLNHFLRELIAAKSTISSLKQNDESQFQRGLALAQQLGFKQAFLLVDVVDVTEQQALQVGTYVQLLLKALSSLSTPFPLSLKFFLPQRLQSVVEKLPPGVLPEKVFSGIITWDDPAALQNLIENRFRSAGRSWIRGFDTLASREVAEQLDRAIVGSAHQSPRRLLWVAQTLIDAHAGRAPTEPTITAGDWQQMRRVWSYGDPQPSPL
ncbi:MAG: hypothetical protein L0332_29815 [Chloroflexi bacterium]|nr:hypothetical protein [Chloroflexota bacterium]MCI0580314.1 hypothetical protein [Chloroflexota bacterium]MCI0648067.1 hypothetical protein [Chloroflexota bacterium]MCI0730898.1 hypothetical protein [Chloroflexota bacterium]